MYLPNDGCDSRQVSCGDGVCLHHRLAACSTRAVTQPPPRHGSTSPSLHMSLRVLGPRSHAQLGLCDTMCSGFVMSTYPLAWQRESKRCACAQAHARLFLHFLATKIRPQHQSTLPRTSAWLFKYTPLRSNPLFPSRQH